MYIERRSSTFRAIFPSYLAQFIYDRRISIVSLKPAKFLFNFTDQYFRREASVCGDVVEVPVTSILGVPNLYDGVSY